MANANISFPLTLRKPETQTLQRVSNLNFFHMINIYEMAAIFQFFHNDQCWYSISVNTQKTEDPNFEGGGGVGNLKFFHMIKIYEVAAIFQFFYNDQCWYSVSIDNWKTGDLNFGESVIWNIYAWIFMRGDFSALVKSAKEICQNRVTHLCVAVVNRLGVPPERLS